MLSAVDWDLSENNIEDTGFYRPTLLAAKGPRGWHSDFYGAAKSVSKSGI